MTRTQMLEAMVASGLLEHATDLDAYDDSYVEGIWFKYGEEDVELTFGIHIG